MDNNNDYQYEEKDDVDYNSNEYDSENSESEEADEYEEDLPELLETINQTPGVASNNNYDIETDNVPTIEIIEEKNQRGKTNTQTTTTTRETSSPLYTYHARTGT